jgi:23S rRNA pseudouridine1911/1915/1917 synthase
VVASDDQTLVQLVAAALREAFPHLPLSNADARRVVIAGAVRVNGAVLSRPGVPVTAGDRMLVAVDPSKLARTRRVAHGPPGILYEDAHVIAVEKPAGLPTHATADPRRPHLVGLVARQLGVAESTVGVHQRLDAGTSGVVVFGRTTAANRGLTRAFAGREVGKVYLAVADGRRRRDLVPGVTWTSRGALGPVGRGRRGRAVAVSRGASARDGQPAETTFTVRARHGDRVVLEARPMTGRQHQIRAHLAGEHAPIIGDTRYDGPAAARMHLHAWRLTLPHPVTGEPLVLVAPPPEGWV